jgi:hypothetical protein
MFRRSVAVCHFCRLVSYPGSIQFVVYVYIILFDTVLRMCVFYVEVQIDLIRDSVIGIVTGPWNKRLRNCGWAQEIYHFSRASRRRLGSTLRHIQWMPAAFPPG